MNAARQPVRLLKVSQDRPLQRLSTCTVPYTTVCRQSLQYLRLI